jgi:hypothetical protein
MALTLLLGLMGIIPFSLARSGGIGESLLAGAIPSIGMPAPNEWGSPFFTLTGGLLLGCVSLLAVWCAAYIRKDPRLTWQSLGMGMMPLAGSGFLLGVLSLARIPSFLPELLAQKATWLFSLLCLSGLLSAWLGMRLLRGGPRTRRTGARIAYLIPIILQYGLWYQHLLYR